MKKTLIFHIFLVSIFSLFLICSSAFDDMPDDWSTAALQSAVDNGLLTGDGNLLKPADSLTRAQMAAITTRAFGAVVEGDISEFSDIPENAWYRDEMAKAYYMNVFRGDGAGHMNPENPVTREEAFVVLARAFCLDENASAEVIERFTDADKVSDWAKGALASMVKEGYVNGSDGKLNPRGNITRAEFAQLMYNLISLYIDDESDLEKISEVKGNVVLRTKLAKLKDLDFNKDLIIADGVSGEIVLDKVDVSNRIVIRGEITLSYVGKTSEIISKLSNVSLTLESGAEVEKVTLPEGAVFVDKSDEKTDSPVVPVNPTPPSDDSQDPEDNEEPEDKNDTEDPENIPQEDIWTGFH